MPCPPSCLPPPSEHSLIRLLLRSPRLPADESFLAVIFLLARASAAQEPLGALSFAFPQAAPFIINVLGTRADDGTSVAAWLALFFFPVFLLKQWISIVHLVRAAQRLVECDHVDT